MKLTVIGCGYLGATHAACMAELHATGARTLAQDEATSVVYGMPRVAWEIGAVEYQLPLTAIAAKITALAGE